MQAVLEFWESELPRYREVLSQSDQVEEPAPGHFGTQPLMQAHWQVPVHSKPWVGASHASGPRPTAAAVLPLPRPRQQTPSHPPVPEEAEPSLELRLDKLERYRQQQDLNMQLTEKRIENDFRNLLLAQLERQQTRFSRYLLHNRLAQANMASQPGSQITP